MNNLLPTPEAIADHSAWLYDLLPPIKSDDENYKYITESSWDTPGHYHYSLWCASWDMQAGNAGWIDNEKFYIVLCLMLCNGLSSDPQVNPGCEIPVLMKPDPKLMTPFHSGIPWPASFTNARDMLPHSVWHGKGYKRLLAANLAFLLCRQLGFIDQLLEDPAVKASFQKILGTITNKSSDDLIGLNREITTKSVATRQKINCFHNLHHIRRKMALSASTSKAYVESLTHAILKSQWGIQQSPKLAFKVILNIGLYTPFKYL